MILNNAAFQKFFDSNMKGIDKKIIMIPYLHRRIMIIMNIAILFKLYE